MQAAISTSNPAGEAYVTYDYGGQYVCERRSSPDYTYVESAASRIVYPRGDRRLRLCVRRRLPGYQSRRIDQYGTDVYGRRDIPMPAASTRPPISAAAAHKYVYGSSYHGEIGTDGYQYVDPGGLAYGANDYWEQIVYGTADYTYVESGGAQYV